MKTKPPKWLKPKPLGPSDGKLLDAAFREIDRVRPNWRALARWLNSQPETPLYRDVCIEIAAAIIYELRLNPTSWNEFDPSRFDDICLGIDGPEWDYLRD
jgi:hypothetical protein